MLCETALDVRARAETRRRADYPTLDEVFERLVEGEPLRGLDWCALRDAKHCCEVLATCAAPLRKVAERHLAGNPLRDAVLIAKRLIEE